MSFLSFFIWNKMFESDCVCLTCINSHCHSSCGGFLPPECDFVASEALFPASRSFLNFLFRPRWCFVFVRLKVRAHVCSFSLRLTQMTSVATQCDEHVVSLRRSVRPRCALRRQWSCLIRCWRTSGAPQTSTRSTGKKKKREGENASWTAFTAQMSSGWTDTGIETWQARAKTTKCCTNAKPRREGGRCCEDGSPARLQSVPALHGGETGTGGTEEEGEKCSKLGRVVHKCEPEKRRPATAAENEHELNEECMSFGIYLWFCKHISSARHQVRRQQGATVLPDIRTT